MAPLIQKQKPSLELRRRLHLFSTDNNQLDGVMTHRKSATSSDVAFEKKEKYYIPQIPLLGKQTDTPFSHTYHTDTALATISTLESREENDATFSQHTHFKAQHI